MRIVLFIGLFALMSCKSGKNTHKETFVPQYTPGPKALVYKTRADYYKLVPVVLSDDKSTIVQYPHPADVMVDDQYMYPTKMQQGYLLDNRGIAANVAFLKYTYEEYAALPEAPDPEELYKYILDKEPLLEMCNCGNKTAFTDIDKQLNDLINHKKLRATCEVIK